jgi:hypothetical protein
MDFDKELRVSANNLFSNDFRDFRFQNRLYRIAISRVGGAGAEGGGGEVYRGGLGGSLFDNQKFCIRRCSAARERHLVEFYSYLLFLLFHPQKLSANTGECTGRYPGKGSSPCSTESAMSPPPCFHVVSHLPTLEARCTTPPARISIPNGLAHPPFFGAPCGAVDDRNIRVKTAARLGTPSFPVPSLRRS